MNEAPWKLKFSGQMHNSDEVVIQVVAHDGVIVACNQQYYPTALDPQNAATITAAPTMLAALCDVKRILEQQNIINFAAREALEVVEFILGIHANLEAKVKAVTT